MFRSVIWLSTILLTTGAVVGCDGRESSGGGEQVDVIEPPPVVRLVRVDPFTESITVRNYDSEPADISNYRVCTVFNYQFVSNLTVISGSLTIKPGEEVVLSGATAGWLLSDTAADLALYRGPTFTNPDEMADFVQWGIPGLGRELVAALKGIWSSGDFIAGSGPYEYVGDGVQNGVSFWSAQRWSFGTFD